MRTCEHDSKSSHARGTWVVGGGSCTARLWENSPFSINASISMTLVQKLASTIRKKCADFYEVGSRKIASTPGSRLCINLRDFQGVNILLQLLVHCSTLTHQSFLSGGHLNIQLYHFKNRKLQSIQYLVFFPLRSTIVHVTNNIERQRNIAQRLNWII